VCLLVQKLKITYKKVMLLMYGTVYLILFVLLVLLFLRNVLELLILVSF